MSPGICIIRRAYYPAESHVRRNAERLIAAGYSVDLICLRNQGEPANEVIGGVNVYRLPLLARRAGLFGYFVEYTFFFFMAITLVSWLHVKKRYAVVEADSMPDALIFAGWLPKLMGAGLILYLFESMPEMWAQKRHVPMTHWTIRLLCWHEKLSCGFADAIICCHDLAKDALVKRGISENKITSILNVPDDKVFQKTNDDESDDVHVFHIIQHGTMTENYGIQIVLQALKLLTPTLPVHFDVVGSGEYKPVLESMVLDLGLAERVTFHGFVSRERLMELLACADVGVVPMLFEYQSPNKMFELVALGKPVIASDRQTFRQHFDENEVLYFRTGAPGGLAKALEEAYEDSTQMKKRAARALLRYQGYRWGTMGKRYLNVYSSLIQGKAA